MLAIIGGSGLGRLDFLESENSVSIQTIFQDKSVEIIRGRYQGQDILFMPRHGESHSIPPHLVNYRANIAALKHAGAAQIVAVNAVGGIDPRLEPGAIAIPDQIIDYTHSRQNTFFDGVAVAINHVDFSYPYDARLRELIINCALASGSKLADAGVIAPELVEEAVPGTVPVIVSDGVYGCTQGPRLETAAEIKKFQQDGCTMVGMTGMPEAVLARELGLAYACIALSVNWGAGINAQLISMEEINAVLQPGMQFISRILEKLISAQPID